MHAVGQLVEDLAGLRRAGLFEHLQGARLAQPAWRNVHAITQQLARTFGPESPGDWRLLPTRANRMPAAASYLRAPGDTEYRAFKLDVMRVEGGLITDVTTFGHSLFPHFGLPQILH